jgi:hypothetical protein
VSVRDPRDAVASIMESGARHEAEGRRTPLSAVARDVRRACNLFKGAYASVLSPDSKGGERMLFVRCEEISAGNEQVARQAGEPCGLSFDADLAERLSALEDPDGGVGRHREVLGPAQVAEIQTRCADFNKVFPYW